MTRWLYGFLLSLFLSLSAAHAEEYIRSYHADIDVAESSELTVTETITVNAEGNRIRRGIFRDFPLTRQTATDEDNASGETVRVGFDLLSVTRNGEREPYHTESVTGGIRIYAGDKDTALRPGEHIYVITYRTDRQILYLDDHDELYWNATGNGWQFRIAKASARVTLPDGARITQTAAYTGAYGATASDARKEINGNQAVFETTRPLGEQQGLTVVVGFPKGVVAPPSQIQQSAWWWRDNIGAVLAVTGLVLVVGYYVFFWRRVGRDPAGGVVVPRWDAPEGLSPALVNYIDNKGFSGRGWTAFAATALDLAVKGLVRLEDMEKRIVITRTEKPVPINLPAGQAALLGGVGGNGESLIIDKANGTRVQSAGQKFRRAIEKEHRGKYYRGNMAYVIGGIGLSVLAVLAVIVFGNLDAEMIPIFFMSGFFAIFFGILASVLGKNLRRGSSLAARIVAVVALGVVGLIVLSILSSVFAAAVMAAEHGPVLASVGGIVLANVIFFLLIGAPTPLGRKLMDGIEGLRIYLTLAEQDRMNMAGAPTMSPAHFEKLLPYAVALGVEKPWSRTFETWLASAAAGVAAASYAPGWYAGGYNSGFGGRVGGFASSMGSTIASTIPAPQSSSSGFSGGGFSGGGGGGGGGGGW